MAALRLAVGGLAVACVLALPSVAGAQAPSQDSVTGTLDTQLDCPAGTTICTGLEFVFDVHSGPSGENPAGTVSVGIVACHGVTCDVLLYASRLTCLAVAGHTATIGIDIVDPSWPAPTARFVVAAVEDNGGTNQDGLGALGEDAAPTVCPPPSTGLQPARTGDVVVTDAQPLPTSKGQCKHGGWRNYPQFKNQGQCVRFVRHQGRQACRDERAAIGRAAFRAKYGKGPHERHAVHRCIRQKIS
jgi:hypothetical protein